MNSFVFAAAMALPAVSGTADAQTARAAQPVQLDSNVMAEKTVVQNGQERIELRKPDRVVPGDRLLFETRFRNVSTMPVQRFVVTNPVPNGVVYNGQSSAGAEVSVDGGRSWGLLPQLKVRAGTATRAAQPSDVTHLRWTLATIAPGAAGSLKYKGSVR